MVGLTVHSETEAERRLTMDSVMSSSSTASSTTSCGQKQLPGHRKQEKEQNRKFNSLSHTHR